MKYLESKKQNIIVTMIFSNVCFIVYHYSGILGNAGMVSILLNLMPIIIGLVTVAFYFVIHKTAEKHAWIVTVFGNLFNISMLLNAYFNA